MINIILSNLITVPILFFLFGILLSAFRIHWLFRPKIHSFLSYFLLFSIGLKGGAAFMQHSNAPQFFFLLGFMIAWGLIQPFISYWLLRKFTKTDKSNAAAISACFGSVSVMTFAAGTAFLEKLNVPYQTVVVAILAIMEVPAIISGLLLSIRRPPPKNEKCQEGSLHLIQAKPAFKVTQLEFESIGPGGSQIQHLSNAGRFTFFGWLQYKSRNISLTTKTKNLWIHTLFNKTIMMIFLGLVIGIICYQLKLHYFSSNILVFFKPFLSLFLLNMGLLIGKQRKNLNQFSWSLSLFGFYMPLLGGAFGILFSYFFGLDPGTGTLIAILSASASYIAVPAALRIAIPEANPAVYLPLSLGIAFPFNVLIGIPIYYVLSMKLLS